MAWRWRQAAVAAVAAMAASVVLAAGAQTPAEAPASRVAPQRIVSLLPSATAIQPYIVGDNEAAVALSKALWERGL